MPKFSDLILQILHILSCRASRRPGPPRPHAAPSHPATAATIYRISLNVVSSLKNIALSIPRIIFPRTHIFQFQPHQHEFLPSAVACQKAPRFLPYSTNSVLLIQSHCGLIVTDHLKFQPAGIRLFRAVNAGAGQRRADSLSPVFPQDTDSEIRAVP